MQDEEVLSQWMEAYGDAVLRSAYLLLRDRHLAEDITQETFLTAYEKMHQLKDTTKVRAWLVQIASNLCRQGMRRAAWKRLIFRERPDDIYTNRIGASTRNGAGLNTDGHGAVAFSTDGFGAFRVSPNGLGGIADEVVTHQTLTESIMQLRYKYREVVILYYYQALSIEEIANLLGDNLSTVKSRLSRARRELRQLLGEEDWLNV